MSAKFWRPSQTERVKAKGKSLNPLFLISVCTELYRSKLGHFRRQRDSFGQSTSAFDLAISSDNFLFEDRSAEGSAVGLIEARVALFLFSRGEVNSRNST